MKVKNPYQNNWKDKDNKFPRNKERNENKENQGIKETDAVEETEKGPTEEKPKEVKKDAVTIKVNAEHKKLGDLFK